MAPNFHLSAKVFDIRSTCANIKTRIISSHTKFDVNWFNSLYTIVIAGHKLNAKLNSTAPLTKETDQHKEHKGILSFKHFKSNRTTNMVGIMFYKNIILEIF